MQKTRKLVIVGNSEIAAMAYEYFTHDSEYEVIGFAIEQQYIGEPEFCGLPVVDFEALVERFPPDDHYAFVGIGDAKLNRVRRAYLNRTRALGYPIATYVSSSASVWHNVEIGENCFIFELNVLQPFVKVGDNVIIWSANHIGHRTVIEDDVFIASHVVISGFCRIGRSSFLGVNVAVANNVTIGADNFIGIGSTIVRDTPDNSMWRGQPAEKREKPTRQVMRIDD